MSNYYAPCSYRIDFVVIPSYIELPWFWQPHLPHQRPLLILFFVVVAVVFDCLYNLIEIF